MTAKHAKRVQTDYAEARRRQFVYWQQKRVEEFPRLPGETALRYRHRLLSAEARIDPKRWAANYLYYYPPGSHGELSTIRKGHAK